MIAWWGIVVAGGAGRRFGSPKQLTDLRDRPLWAWARDTLTEAGAARVVVVGPVPGGVPGGPRRRDSVRAGLAQVPPDVAHVLIHDAARPLASSDLARRVVTRLEAGDVAGVVPAIAVRDTLKAVVDDLVRQTIGRQGLVAVQTPQGFVTPALLHAHDTVEGDAPDDAWLIERVGEKVAVVPGEPTNLKITYPDDLRLAESILEAGRP